MSPTRSGMLLIASLALAACGGGPLAAQSPADSAAWADLAVTTLSAQFRNAQSRFNLVLTAADSTATARWTTVVADRLRDTLQLRPTHVDSLPTLEITLGPLLRPPHGWPVVEADFTVKTDWCDAVAPGTSGTDHSTSAVVRFVLIDGVRKVQYRPVNSFAGQCAVRHAPALVVGTCHSQDSLSANLLSYVRAVATGTDTASANTRAAWGIPLVAANKVNPVTQAQKCTALASAYDAAAATPGNANRSIDAVTIDKGFVVVDRTNRSGEWMVAMVFDSQMALQEKFAF